MTKVMQHLWFEQDMEAARRLYTALIPGSRLDWIAPMPADTPSGPADKVRMAAMLKMGKIDIAGLEAAAEQK